MAIFSLLKLKNDGILVKKQTGEKNELFNVSSSFVCSSKTC